MFHFAPMDFRDSEHEAAFRAEVRAFLEAHAPAERVDYYAEDLDDDKLVAWSQDWQRTLYEHSWAALMWPKEYGGRGLGPVEAIVWNQELARVGIGESIFVVGIGMAGPTIIAHGNEEQKQRYLPPMLEGREIWCQLFSEPGAGSDLAAVATRAERDGDEWVVNGQKVWCSGGHYADWGILLARTDPDLPKHAGITYFLVDMRSAGIDVRPLRQMTGGAHFNEVYLEDVRIPDANRLGELGEGWAAAKTTLMNERMAMGGIDRMFKIDELVEHVRAHKERLDPVARDQVARLYTWVRTLELMNARMVTALGRGMMPGPEASVMKLAIARIVTLSSEIALDVLGPDGTLRSGPWQNQFLFAPSLHIAGGTDEIQKTLAAENALGMPREQRGDKRTPFKDLPK